MAAQPSVSPPFRRLRRLLNTTSKFHFTALGKTSTAVASAAPPAPQSGGGRTGRPQTSGVFFYASAAAAVSFTEGEIQSSELRFRVVPCRRFRISPLHFSPQSTSTTSSSFRRRRRARPRAPRGPAAPVVVARLVSSQFRVGHRRRRREKREDW